MSTDKTWRMLSTSSDETEKIGQKLGTQFKGGEIIELVSDLGGGKTTFVRGLAKGMGSTDKVSSPTFTLSKQYRCGDLLLMHYDFYRLNDPGILEFELVESIADPNVVTVIEWADVVQDVLPPKRLTIRINSTGDDSRQFDFTAPSELGYLAGEVR